MGDSRPSKQAKNEMAHGRKRLSHDSDRHPGSLVAKLPETGTMAVQWDVLAEANGGEVYLGAAPATAGWATQGRPSRPKLSCYEDADACLSTAKGIPARNVTKVPDVGTMAVFLVPCLQRLDGRLKVVQAGQR